jgi:predicted dienelactone hydrolase
VTLSVGCIAAGVRDEEQGVELPVWLLYPSSAPERDEQFGPYRIALSMDAALEGAVRGVVIVSHGNNGTPWTHRDTACELVRSNYAVVLVEHIGNSRSDGSLERSFENLVNRPRHVRLALDWALGNSKFASALRSKPVAGVGHSIGVYTLLAAAGGHPTAFAQANLEGPQKPVPVQRDARLRALVLLAPASIWFSVNGSLSEVDVPILLRAGEQDALTPALHSELIVRGVQEPDRVDYRVVPGAGHFSFQSPFPASMTRPDFPPSQDPPGFDRRAYQKLMNAEILSFLERQLVS